MPGVNPATFSYRISDSCVRSCAVACDMGDTVVELSRHVMRYVGPAKVKHHVTISRWSRGYTPQCRECRPTVKQLNASRRLLDRTHGTYIGSQRSTQNQWRMANVRFLLWPPCVADADIIFLSCDFYLLSIFFSSPNLSGRRLDVYTILRHMMWP